MEEYLLSLGVTIDAYSKYLEKFKDEEKMDNMNSILFDENGNLNDLGLNLTNRKETIKIKYFTDIESITINPKGDWVDLRSAIDIDLLKGEFKLIPLGVGMKLPEGYEAHIVPRSSTFKNFGVIQTNHQAVVDESFCGDNDQWFYPVLAMRDTKICKNDRICQFRIMKKQPELYFETVEHLGEIDRGGHGSSGVK